MTAARAGDPAIEVAGLVKQYGRQTVLDRIDLVVRPGELVALLGPNGAGKTTTVEIIEGYRTPDAGSVRVLGHEPRAGGPMLRARVGIMLQGADGLQPRATARETLGLYGAFHRGGRAPGELLAATGLEAVADRSIRRLSGGERQRLALAIALVGEPEVLVLDEPTAGLDPEARLAARRLIERLQGEGRAILLTTHDLADAEQLADRVVILHRGRIAADAEPTALVAGGPAAGVRVRLHAPPGEAALARLRGALAPAGGELAGDGAERPDALVIPPGAAAADVIAVIAGWAAREGLLIVELRSGAGSLETRYLELTGDTDVEDTA